MNQMQKMSQKILTDRLKLQLGLALDSEVDYHTLRRISLELKRDKLQRMAHADVSYLASQTSKAA